MVTGLIGTDALGTSRNPGAAARSMGPAERRELSIQVLARSNSINALAFQRGVSRKFVCQQRDKAAAALAPAFEEACDQDVLSFVPITKEWIKQFVLELALEGHASYRGIIQIAQDMVHCHLSLGTISNILRGAASKARVLNKAQDLSGVRVGGHDEIYQADKPVLVGVDLHSTYCYLLSEEEHCDQTTWGVHLLDLDHQGLHPRYTVADCAKGLRSGQQEAWKDVPCHADVFHVQRQMEEMAIYLENRASRCAQHVRKLEHRVEHPKLAGKIKTVSARLKKVRQMAAQALALAQDVRTLTQWMRDDILPLAGPTLAVRRELYDFVVGELMVREKFCRHRIWKVRRALEEQRQDILAFAEMMEADFAGLARKFDVPSCMVQALCQLEAMDRNSPEYWQGHGSLLRRLGAKFLPLQQAVRDVMADTRRASSLAENLNGRLRGYFFLRRELGDGYLDLLQFFLNHHTFQRSRRPERIGKSPTQLLTGKDHPHWLELLGFQRFHQQ